MSVEQTKPVPSLEDSLAALRDDRIRYLRERIVMLEEKLRDAGFEVPVLLTPMDLTLVDSHPLPTDIEERHV